MCSHENLLMIRPGSSCKMCYKPFRLLNSTLFLTMYNSVHPTKAIWIFLDALNGHSFVLCFVTTIVIWLMCHCKFLQLFQKGFNYRWMQDKPLMCVVKGFRLRENCGLHRAQLYTFMSVTWVFCH